MRRDFSLPSEDIEWLESTGRPYELVNENGVMRVVLHQFPVPPGYSSPLVEVCVRIESGYPDSQLDMAYFFPALSRLDGQPIGATSGETFHGKTWQRWSRHRTPANPWRPGIDNLGSHCELIADWIDRELRK
jgi:E2/UBC family protein E